MRVYAPSEWGATMDYDSWTDPFTPDDGIALHHGGWGDYPAHQPPYTFDKEARQLRSWERYHLSKGWRGLAYGWAVGQSGNLYRIRGFNRYGAHLGDIDGDGIANNDEIVPIVFIGSGSRVTLSPAADTAVNWLRINIIEATSPKATRLYGHKEIQPKPTSCPGQYGMQYVTAHRTTGETTGGEDIMKVIDIQKALNKAGQTDYQGKALVEDDDYGPRTESALVKGYANIIAKTPPHVHPVEEHTHPFSGTTGA